MKLTAEQRKVIADTIMVDKKGNKASHSEVDAFCAQCEQTELDPFKRHITASPRNCNVGTRDNPKWVVGWMTIVTIDGLRALAEKTGEYEGQEGPFYCGADGVWVDVWVKPTSELVASKVIVHRKGFKTGLVGIARTAAYRQKGEVWDKLTDHMTAKCAEAIALRRAFPQQMGGLYTSYEMGKTEGSQDDSPQEEPPLEWEDAERQKAKDAIFAYADVLVDQRGYDPAEVMDFIRGSAQFAAIGSHDVTYDKWLDRFVTWCDRVDAKKFPERQFQKESQ